MFHVEAGLLATGSPDKTVEVMTMIIITEVMVNGDDDGIDEHKMRRDGKRWW